MIGTLVERRRELERAYPVWEQATLWTRFAQIAQRYPNYIFLKTDTDAYTYRDILFQAHRQAMAFEQLGVKAGDRVGLLMGNCAEYVTLTFALARLGAVKVPLNTKLPVNDWRYMLNKAEVRCLVIISEPALAPRVDELFQQTVIQVPGINTFITSGVSEPLPSHIFRHITWDKFCEMGGTGLESQPWEDWNQASDIIYTSGCTGKPKGVLLTHDMLWRSAYANCLNRGFEFGRRIFIPLPLFHVYGYVEGLLAAVLVHGSIILTNQKCTATHMLDILENHQANDILAIPAMMMQLLQADDWKQRDLSSFHAVYCSASACPKWVWSGIRQQLGVSDVITGYGMTEVAGASMQTDPEDSTQRLESSVGKVISAGSSGMDEFGGKQLVYRVVNPDTGKELPMGETGELCCKGLTVMTGYDHEPIGTAAVMDQGGWFHTGDLGFFDADGYLYLNGRTHDIYKINGENVSPRFIEDRILECKLVRFAEVVGIPDPKLGEAGVAFLELKEPSRKQDVIHYCKANLGSFQIPKYIFFLPRDMWPQTSTGKVQKEKLKNLAQKLLMEDAQGVVYSII